MYLISWTIEGSEPEKLFLNRVSSKKRLLEFSYSETAKYALHFEHKYEAEGLLKLKEFQGHMIEEVERTKQPFLKLVLQRFNLLASFKMIKRRRSA